MADPPAEQTQSLERGLGVTDAILVTVGAVVGTGIFITTGDMARVLPHPWLILLAWVLGGGFALTGALTYAELGGLFPRAGGQYQYLKETYGTFVGFLFGWIAFFVIMTAGMAAPAVGFGEYLGSFVPFFSTRHVLWSTTILGWIWNVSGGQLAAALAIAFLTAVNYVGVRAGAGVQNAVTIVKIGSLVGFALLGLLVAQRPLPPLSGHATSTGLIPAFGVALIAVFWSYDGWYGMTNLAGEMKRPATDLPRGLMLGTLAVTLLYTLINVVYVRTLSVEEMAATPRIGETAAAALFGPLGARLLSAAVLVSAFGNVSATILYAARIYLPMAQDGVFFSAIARIHPRYLTPANSILAQGVWAIVLTFSGTYEQLYTLVIFASVMFHAATGAAVFVLRKRLPDAPRPYRVWGYPVVPALFVLASLAIVWNTLMERPLESVAGLGILAVGVPFYLWWRRGA